MKIAVLGAGAIGGLIGGLLAADMKDVKIVGRGNFINAVKDKGLKIRKISGIFNGKLNKGW